MRRFLLRWRPFLWWLGLILLFQGAVHLSGDRLHYDDGGFGGIVFLVNLTIGLPFVLGAQLGAVFAEWVGIERDSSSLLFTMIVVAFGNAPFLLADGVTRWWAMRGARSTS